MLEIKVTRFQEPKGNVLGLASFKYNEQFLVKNICIMKNMYDETFVSMPSYKRKEPDADGNMYKQYVNPVTCQFRLELYDAILEQFEKGGGKQVLGDDEPHVSFEGYFNPYQRENSNIRGLVNLVIDGKFAVNGIGVYPTGKGNYHMVSMPSYKTNQTDEKGNPIYKEICHPVESEFAKALYKMINDIAQKNVKESVHFNESGVISEKAMKNQKMQGAEQPEDDFLSIPDDMMGELPFMDDEEELAYAASDGRDAEEQEKKKDRDAKTNRKPSR